MNGWVNFKETGCCGYPALLGRYCFVVWVLFRVFLTFCITSFGDCTRPQQKETTATSSLFSPHLTRDFATCSRSPSEGCCGSHCWFPRFCVLVWVLFSVLSTFCITLIGDCTRPQYKETTATSSLFSPHSTGHFATCSRSPSEGCCGSHCWFRRFVVAWVLFSVLSTFCITLFWLLYLSPTSRNCRNKLVVFAPGYSWLRHFLALSFGGLLRKPLLVPSLLFCGASVVQCPFNFLHYVIWRLNPSATPRNYQKTWCYVSWGVKHKIDPLTVFFNLWLGQVTGGFPYTRRFINAV